MKTIFKKGMTVYDSLNFTKLKGEIVEIKESDDKTFSYPVVVKFDGVVNDKFYSEDGIIAGSLSKTLSTKPYEVKLEGFEQKESKPTYNSVRAESLRKGEYVTILNNIELPNERIGKAFEAFVKLIWLRNYYNENWKVDWNKPYTKYCIEIDGDNVIGEDYTYITRVMYFKTPEIRDKFIEEQIDLLEIAKPLL